MEKFTFKVEQKSTIWEYGSVDIEAETYEEAKEKVIAMFEENLDGRYIDDLVEPDLQTIERMDPSQNDDRPTLLLYDPFVFEEYILGKRDDDEEDYVWRLWDNSNN